MRRRLLAFLVIPFLVSCGGGGEHKVPTDAHDLAEQLRKEVKDMHGLVDSLRGKIGSLDANADPSAIASAISDVESAAYDVDAKLSDLDETAQAAADDIDRFNGTRGRHQDPRPAPLKPTSLVSAEKR